METNSYQPYMMDIPPLLRWIIAVVLAFDLILSIVGVGIFGVMAMAFGSDSCDQISGDTSLFLLVGAPTVMALGVITAALLFGLNKRWYVWLGLLAISGVLGICGYAFWFVLVSQWCG